MCNKWNEAIESALINGTELSPVVKETIENYKKNEKLITIICDIISKLSTLKYKLADMNSAYDGATNSLNGETLNKLNDEAKIVNKIMDANFSKTLYDLSVEEGETKKEIEDRIKKELSL